MEQRRKKVGEQRAGDMLGDDILSKGTGFHVLLINELIAHVRKREKIHFINQLTACVCKSLGCMCRNLSKTNIYMMQMLMVYTIHLNGKIEHGYGLLLLY